MESLPNDIFYEISKWLSLKDITNFQNANKIIKNNILALNNNLLILSLKKFNKNTHNKYNEHLFYDFFMSNFNKQCYKYQRMMYKYYYNNPNYINIINLKEYIILCRSNLQIINPTNNTMINDIYNRIFMYYLTNDFQKLELYPNKIEMMVLYNLLHIYIYKNIYTMDYLFDFLSNLNNPSSYRIKLSYYNHILNILHNDPLIFHNTFNKYYIMSPFICSMFTLKRLFGYKILNLNNSKLIICCNDCFVNSIYDMCIMKMHIYKDNLIKHNYNEIKHILKIQNKLYYDTLIERETFLINEKIYIKNPITNRRMRINGNYYKNFIKKYNNIPQFKNIEKHIEYKREIYRKIFF